MRKYLHLDKLCPRRNQRMGVTINAYNGVKILLKPTDFKNDQVIMTASRFAVSIYSTRKTGIMQNMLPPGYAVE